MSQASVTPPVAGAHRGAPKFRRLLRTAFWLLVLVLLAWYVVGRARDASAVHGLEAEARRRGEPLTLKQLALTYPPIADEQNAAVPLLALWEKEDPAVWGAFRNGQRPLPEHVEPDYNPELPYLGKNRRSFKIGQKLTPVSREAAEAFLRERALHLDAVRSALERPRCRFPVTIEDRFDVWPHLHEIRTDAQVLRIAALLAADRGDRSAALASLQDIFSLSDTLAAEPITISQFVRVVCLHFAIAGMQDLLAREALSVEELRRLQEMLESISPRKMLRQCLVIERATDLSVFDPPDPSATRTDSDAQDSEQYAANYHFAMRALSILGFTIGDRRLMFETSGQMIGLSDQDWPAAFLGARVVSAALDKKVHTFPPKIFSGRMLPMANKVVERHTKLEAHKRSALVALMVEQYRIQHKGALPEQLDALGPEILPHVPKDPFDGQPLRYRRLAKGYVVYSVGADLKDDGGVRPTGRGSQTPLDETFTVERSE